MPLRDVLTSHPRVLFVGINPSLRSEAAGHHFASPGNPFWRLLHASSFTPEPLTYADDRRLPEFGLALTNLCPRASRSASELTPDEFKSGKRRLERKIRRVRPDWVVFVGVTLYEQFFGRSRLGTGGPGLKPDRIDGAPVFVLPNPSGLNASFPSFASKLVWFERLRDVLQSGTGESGKPTRTAKP